MPLAARAELAPRTVLALANGTGAAGPAAAAFESASMDDVTRELTRSEVERLAAAAGASELAPRLAVVFIERRVRNIADLDRLDRELRALERTIEARLADRSRSGRRIPARTESN